MPNSSPLTLTLSRQPILLYYFGATPTLTRSVALHNLQQYLYAS